MGIQVLFIFIPDVEKRDESKDVSKDYRDQIILFFSYTWMLNFLAPSKFIVTTCSTIYILLSKTFIMIVIWNFLSFTNTYKNRLIGIVCILHWKPLIIFVILVLAKFFYSNFEFPKAPKELPLPATTPKKEKKPKK